MRLFSVIFLAVFLPVSVRADDLVVAGVFSDHAVLQQGVVVPVWGTSTPSTQVTVRFAGQTQSTIASQNGSWRIELAPLAAASTGRTMVVASGDQQEKIRDLLVGEVWYASGQSNMQMRLDACAKKVAAIGEIVKAPTVKQIRVLRIDAADAPDPQTEIAKESWQVDSPRDRGKLSAVAYFFARQLNEKLGVPIGVIEGSWGGKPIEGFIPRGQFRKHKALAPILALADQDKLSELAALEGGVIVRNTPGRPGRIFNTRVAPIAPYALRGFIWYQGESNAGRGEDPRNYRIKMRALIDGWREAWGQDELPFYFVQLPAFKDEVTGWVRLREEQRLSLDVPHTGMAVTIDLNEADIHPADKIAVGDRLAYMALAKTYEKNVPFCGPLFKSAKVDGNVMRVEFSHAEKGLMVANKSGLNHPRRTPEVALRHFELADNAGNWHPARAKIDGQAVVVQSDDVSNPRAVRYACSGAPVNANLYNQSGLPASPFCSELELLPWERQQ